MDSRYHAGSSNPTTYLLEIINSAGIFVTPLIMTARLGEVRIINNHRFKPCLSGKLDIAVDIVERHSAKFVI